eukprot:3662159-Rhodomonas_salina.2
MRSPVLTWTGLLPGPQVSPLIPSLSVPNAITLRARYAMSRSVPPPYVLAMDCPVLAYRMVLHREIEYKKPHFQYKFCQECGFLYLISRSTVLRSHFAMFSTIVLAPRMVLPSSALAMEYPVPTNGMVLPGPLLEIAPLHLEAVVGGGVLGKLKTTPGGAVLKYTQLENAPRRVLMLCFAGDAHQAPPKTGFLSYESGLTNQQGAGLRGELDAHHFQNAVTKLGSGNLRAP